MNYPADLHVIVDQLAIAKKKLRDLEERVAGVPALQAEVDQLQARLVIILDRAGFDEAAVDLLLAAR